MLDGLLGRGFTVKCKSVIKTTRTRIGVVRRRAEAKQRLLKEDLTKLLSNGLDINAYGRTEEFIAGMNLLSSYDFVEKSCEHIVKHLSRMQKQSECPEECREAVASLMFAAARFSDLPELRDLRDTFQHRYGNGLQVFVNQKFVEKLSSRPPAAEKRLQVLHDIASEFAIKWDSRAFQRRMATPPVVAQAEVTKPDAVKQRSFRDEKLKVPSYVNVDAGRRDEVENREPSLRRGGYSSHDENKLSHPTEERVREIKIDKSSSSSHKQTLDNDPTRYTRLHDHEELPQLPPTYLKPPTKYEKVVSPYRRNNQDNVLKSIRIDEEDHAPSKSPPPPYVRCKNEHVKSDMAKHIAEPGSCRTSNAVNHSHFEDEMQFIAPGKVKRYGREKEFDYQEDNIPLDKHSKTSRSRNKPRHFEHQMQFIAPGKVVRRYGFDNYEEENIPLDKHSKTSRSRNEPRRSEHQMQFIAPGKVVRRYGRDDYEEENIPLPKPRYRRRHHKSSSSRRDRPKRGLRTLIDEERLRKDDEERMIDELLLHYSKQPSSYDAESSMKSGKFVPPPRSISLPRDQMAASSSPEPLKVFNRANSFQPDNHARHVHPKLPDYDDLAARFAALRSR